MFVTFEGTEGSGKSTQIDRLAQRLRDIGQTVVVTREPGGTALGERLRGLLLEDEYVPTAVTEAYLMTAARAEHVQAVISPALERGDWVLCDRFSDSTIAYQGAGRGVDVTALKSLQALATGGLAPDLTILLDVDVLEGLRRRTSEGEGNRIDREEVSFHQRVAAWYRGEAQRRSDQWIVIDANQSIEVVEQAIVEAMSIRSAWPVLAN